MSPGGTMLQDREVVDHRIAAIVLGAALLPGSYSGLSGAAQDAGGSNGDGGDAADDDDAGDGADDDEPRSRPDPSITT